MDQKKIKPQLHSKIFSRFFYYLSALPTILFGVKNLAEVLSGLLAGRKPVVLLKDGTRVKIRSLFDLWVVKEVCLDRQYECAGTGLQNRWTIVDIGAAFGEFAVYGARKTPQSTYFAYEPLKESFDLLQENVQLNQLQNVRAFNLAVTGARTAAVLNPGYDSRTYYDTQQGDELPAITLRQIFEDNKIERCDFLKMDCEGGEFEILMNSQGVLPGIKFICLEYHNGLTEFNHEQLKSFLKENHFIVKDFPSPVYKETGLIFAENLKL